MIDADLLVVEDLKKHFPIRAGLMGRVANYVKAVDGVSFTVRAGETLGLVGESGCGKTTVGRSLLRLIEPTAGSVRFKGQELTKLSNRQMRAYRREMQIIFQDPYSSLNPRMTVEGIIGEALTVHGIAKGPARRVRVGELLERCGLSAKHMSRYPHEFSGGQRQRVGIARALALEPQFIVCDEAVSALDVSIQAQVINLLMDIQDEMGIAYLFIAHDLSVVEHISTRVAVMYLGRMVEVSTSEELYENPLHPYTRALLSAVPVPDPTRRHERILLEGDVPTPINPPSGCRFHTRCWLAEERCKREVPPLRDIGKDHLVACHFVDAQKRALIKDGLVIPPGAGKDWRKAAEAHAKGKPLDVVEPASKKTPPEGIKIDPLKESDDGDTGALKVDTQADTVAPPGAPADPRTTEKFPQVEVPTPGAAEDVDDADAQETLSEDDMETLAPGELEAEDVRGFADLETLVDPPAAEEPEEAPDEQTTDEPLDLSALDPDADDGAKSPEDKAGDA